MTNNSMKSLALQSEAETAVHLLDDWFDPIETGLRDRVRELIQAMIESELEAALSRPRYARRPKGASEKADSASGGPPARPPITVSARDLRPGRDRGAAGPARHRGGPDNRVEEHGAAGLPAANQAGRFADRWRLSCRD